MKIQMNDGIGSRGIQHKNLLVVPGQGIVEFVGESIAPVCRVLREDYEKNGKWSHTTWTVDLQGAFSLTWKQDWGTGAWFRATGLKYAVDEITAHLPEGHDLSTEQVERAIRAIWPKTAAKLVAVDAEFESAGDQVGDLIKAQEEHAEALAGAQQVLAGMEAAKEAERLRGQAAKLREATEKVRGGSMSLEDLKAMMA